MEDDKCLSETASIPYRIRFDPIDVDSFSDAYKCELCFKTFKNMYEVYQHNSEEPDCDLKLICGKCHGLYDAESLSTHQCSCTLVISSDCDTTSPNQHSCSHRPNLFHANATTELNSPCSNKPSNKLLPYEILKNISEGYVDDFEEQDCDTKVICENCNGTFNVELLSTHERSCELGIPTPDCDTTSPDQNNSPQHYLVPANTTESTSSYGDAPSNHPPPLQHETLRNTYDEQGHNSEEPDCVMKVLSTDQRSSTMGIPTTDRDIISPSQHSTWYNLRSGNARIVSRSGCSDTPENQPSTQKTLKNKNEEHRHNFEEADCDMNMICEEKCNMTSKILQSPSNNDPVNTTTVCSDRHNFEEADCDMNMICEEKCNMTSKILQSPSNNDPVNTTTVCSDMSSNQSALYLVPYPVYIERDTINCTILNFNSEPISSRSRATSKQPALDQFSLPSSVQNKVLHLDRQTLTTGSASGCDAQVICVNSGKIFNSESPSIHQSPCMLDIPSSDSDNTSPKPVSSRQNLVPANTTSVPTAGYNETPPNQPPSHEVLYPPCTELNTINHISKSVSSCRPALSKQRSRYRFILPASMRSKVFNRNRRTLTTGSPFGCGIGLQVICAKSDRIFNAANERPCIFGIQTSDCDTTSLNPSSLGHNLLPTNTTTVPTSSCSDTSSNQPPPFEVIYSANKKISSTNHPYHNFVSESIPSCCPEPSKQPPPHPVNLPVSTQNRPSVIHFPPTTASDCDMQVMCEKCGEIFKAEYLSMHQHLCMLDIQTSDCEATSPNPLSSFQYTLYAKTTQLSNSDCGNTSSNQSPLYEPLYSANTELATTHHMSPTFISESSSSGCPVSPKQPPQYQNNLPASTQSTITHHETHTIPSASPSGYVATSPPPATHKTKYKIFRSKNSTRETPTFVVICRSVPVYAHAVGSHPDCGASSPKQSKLDHSQLISTPINKVDTSRVFSTTILPCDTYPTPSNISHENSGKPILVSTKERPVVQHPENLTTCESTLNLHSDETCLNNDPGHTNPKNNDSQHLIEEPVERQRPPPANSDREPGARPSICQYCGKISKNEIDLKKHEVTHTWWEQRRKNHLRLYLCQYCGNFFSYRRSLMRHEQGHKKENGPLKCKYAHTVGSHPDCGASSPKQSKLDHSKLISTRRNKVDTSRVFSTTILPCDTYPTPSNISHENSGKPILVSTKERPVVQHPENLTTCESTLNPHSDETCLNNDPGHTNPKNNDSQHLIEEPVERQRPPPANSDREEPGARPSICQYCGEISKNEIDLKKHEVTHTWWEQRRKNHLRLYLCQYCGNFFSYRRSLIRHEQGHKKENGPLECKYCKRVFKRKANLRSHMAIKHTQ